MINNFFKLTRFMLLSLISLTSCKDDDATTTDKVAAVELNNSNAETINKVINFESVPTYTYTFNPTEDLVYTTPSKDLTLRIPANSIIKKGGGSLPAELTVVVREYLNLGDMLLGGVQTISDKKPLVTGGNFYWEIKDKDGNTGYDVGNSVEAEMKIKTQLTNEDLNNMRYFKGEETVQDNVITLNWTEGKAESWVGENPNNPEGEGPSFFIYGIEVGWVNCDYLYQFIGKEATQFKVQLKAKESYKITATRLLMVSNSFPSVVSITSIENGFYKTYEKSIPSKLNATLFALGENKDGKVFLSELDIDVKGDDVFEMELKPSTKDEIKNKLKLK